MIENYGIIDVSQFGNNPQNRDLLGSVSTICPELQNRDLLGSVFDGFGRIDDYCRFRRFLRFRRH